MALCMLLQTKQMEESTLEKNSSGPPSESKLTKLENDTKLNPTGKSIGRLLMNSNQISNLLAETTLQEK